VPPSAVAEGAAWNLTLKLSYTLLVARTTFPFGTGHNPSAARRATPARGESTRLPDRMDCSAAYMAKPNFVRTVRSASSLYRRPSEQWMQQ
jgi:hypothetical protein